MMRQESFLKVNKALHSRKKMKKETIILVINLNKASLKTQITSPRKSKMCCILVSRKVIGQLLGEAWKTRSDRLKHCLAC